MVDGDPRGENPIEKALPWLKSHLKRLQVERDSLRSRLDEVTREVERVEREIVTAERASNPAGKP